MFTCHACSRHVRPDSRSCPFCGASLRSDPAPTHAGFVMGAVLGLALVSCGEPDTGDEGASTQASTADGTGTTSDPSATSQPSTVGQETATPGDTFEAEAADYGGPEVTGLPPDDSSGGTTGGASTGATGDTDASTGSSSG
ncbi:MAG: hypothetical protein H6712_07425 [Myxococcales bacterium]|nr:hypothetical protein [Myxococcales bacterium]MCB9713665.1 hypothetical protein [Myxococcales bacterium]